MTKKFMGAVLCAVMIAASAACSAQPPGSPSGTVTYRADYPSYQTLEDLAQRADLVVRGTVTSTRVAAINDAIQPTSSDPKANPGGDTPASTSVYTVYTISVTDVYKGAVPASKTIEVKDLGGTLNGVTYVSEDSVNFKPNKKYILFLETYPQSPAMLLNPVQASFSGDTDAQGNYPGTNPKNTLKLPPGQLKKLFGK